MEVWNVFGIDGNDIIIISSDLSQPLPEDILQTEDSIQVVTSTDQIAHYSPQTPDYPPGSPACKYLRVLIILQLNKNKMIKN